MAQMRMTCFGLGQILRKIGAVRQQAPVVFELMFALLILCILLLTDILWLGKVHSTELHELEIEHANHVQQFRKQYDAQMHEIQSQHKRLGGDLVSAHAQEVDRLKLDHHQDLEKKIKAIQDELNGLIVLSKTYWEKHASQHHVDIDFQAPSLDNERKK